MLPQHCVQVGNSQRVIAQGVLIFGQDPVVQSQLFQNKIPAVQLQLLRSRRSTHTQGGFNDCELFKKLKMQDGCVNAIFRRLIIFQINGFSVRVSHVIPCLNPSNCCESQASGL